MTSSGPAASRWTPGSRRWTLGDADWNSWPAGRGDGEVWERAARLGLQGVEVGVYAAGEQLSGAREDGRAAAIAAQGVPVSAVLVSLVPDRWPDGALSGRADDVVALARAGAASAAEHGAVLGVWPGADLPDADPTAFRDGCAALVDAVGSVGLEPKPGTLLADVDALLALAADVPGVHALLDTGHSFAGGTDPAAEVHLLMDAGLLAHVHLGDARPGGADDDLPLGDVHDPGPLLAALDGSGYRGHATFDLYGAALAAAGQERSEVEDPVEASVAALVRAARRAGPDPAP